MAARQSSSDLPPELREWVSADIQDDFLRALQLSNEESDPPEEPYKSLYAARELLLGLRTKLDSCPVPESSDYLVLCACLQLQFGLNYYDSEETGRAEETLEACLRLLEGNPDKLRTAMPSIRAYNALGILWGNRAEHQKSLEYLLKAKAVYESHIAMDAPVGEEEWLSGKKVDESGRMKAFEGLHTLTLFYLAQAYGNLGHKKLMGQYCQMTLSRQMETQEYDAIEWSLNCSLLSQYYTNVNEFRLARHCLASSTAVLRQFTEEGDLTQELQEKVEDITTDVDCCWITYCLNLLTMSKDIREGVSCEPAKIKPFRFDQLEVGGVEAEVSCDPIENSEAAKAVFLFAQKHLKRAKEIKTLDTHASQYVKLTQDHSQMFKLLTFFEDDPALQCRMHKRRIDLLCPVLEVLNPQHFLPACRQLMMEIAETYKAMADLKIITASEDPSLHAVGKVNRLVSLSIHFFQKFVDSFRVPVTSQLPDPLDEDYARSILCAKLHMGRLHSRFITPSPQEEVSNLHTSLALYNWLVSYCNSHPEVAARVFADELQICRELVELLPLKIAAKSHDVSTGASASA